MPESRRDTGQRRPLPDISAMQDTGRSPLHLLLDDRASRDGARGSDRRRRARDLARQPRTLRRQEDQGRLGKEGRHRVQETHRQHHARTGHDERVHAQTIQTARYSRAWFRLLVSNRGSFVLANEEIVHRTRAMPFTSKTKTQSAQESGRYGVVTFCWTPVSLFFDYAMSPSSRLRLAMLVPKVSLIRSSRYQVMYASSRSMNPLMVTPAKSRPWKNSCLRRPKNPSAAALSGEQCFCSIVC